MKPLFDLSKSWNDADALIAIALGKNVSTKEIEAYQYKGHLYICNIKEVKEEKS